MRFPGPVIPLRSRGLDDLDLLEHMSRFHGCLDAVFDIVRAGRRALATGIFFNVAAFMEQIRTRKRRLEQNVPHRGPGRAERLRWLRVLSFGFFLYLGVVPREVYELPPRMPWDEPGHRPRQRARASGIGAAGL